MILWSAGLIVFIHGLISFFCCSIAPLIAESYFNDRTYSLSRRAKQPERRELDYIPISAQRRNSQEVKILDLSGVIIDRFRQRVK